MDVIGSTQFDVEILEIENGQVHAEGKYIRKYIVVERKVLRFMFSAICVNN